MPSWYGSDVGSLTSSDSIFIAALIALLGVAPVVAILSAARHDSEVWRRAGFTPNAKWVWIVLCFVLGPAGGIGYLVGIRPKLRRAATA
jgi:hypothetical protein